MEVLRTPDERFARRVDYDFEPRYHELSILEKLLEAGADVSVCHQPGAAQRTCSHHRADVAATDANGFTPLHDAIDLWQRPGCL